MSCCGCDPTIAARVDNNVSLRIWRSQGSPNHAGNYLQWEAEGRNPDPGLYPDAVPINAAGGLRGAFHGGQSHGGTQSLGWSHTLDVADAVNLRDGLTRPAGTNLLNYDDGDYVLVTHSGAEVLFVVVWVEQWNGEFRRAYLMRHMNL